MKQLNIRISRNEKVAQDFYKMRLESPYLAKAMNPGQFIEVRCSDSFEPLLRRPFSLHKILKNEIEILYEVVGKGTTALSQRKVGEYLDIIGPLGNGFDIDRTAYRIPPRATLIAGGMGVAPLVALAKELAKTRARTSVIIGARTKARLLCEDEFKKFGAKVKIATEDGSKGKKGFATDLLKDILLTTNNLQLTTIYACGPNAMLKEVARIAGLRRIPCHVSLEEYMACGVGVCLGCPVKVKPKITNYQSPITNYEYKMVCKDGPVFNAEEIIW